MARRRKRRTGPVVAPAHTRAGKRRIEQEKAAAVKRAEDQRLLESFRDSDITEIFQLEAVIPGECHSTRWHDSWHPSLDAAIKEIKSRNKTSSHEFYEKHYTIYIYVLYEGIYWSTSRWLSCLEFFEDGEPRSKGPLERAREILDKMHYDVILGKRSIDKENPLLGYFIKI